LCSTIAGTFALEFPVRFFIGFRLHQDHDLRVR
jgi:hypothetical protein